MLSIDRYVQLLAKDRVTYAHSLRVARLAKIMSGSMSMSVEEKQNLIIGCLFHDIGKLFIPEAIVFKDAPLSEQEYEVMKQHPLYGAQFLEYLFGRSHPIIDTVRLHHEKWDGSGYPYGKQAQLIPVNARICSILDAFDCMVSDRPYRRGMDIDRARAELLKHGGTQFDNDLVSRFVQLPDSVLQIYNEGSDTA